ncbi:hypothetical protein NP233_g3878 [Leucocoprinus birnbaumii]|uniref:Uncharacterized protein n=1 Tax=Leucocoprinus birnbaumii TaxID=56174 RepID=A0AAD5YSE7_9AGAR|nr:hypothetical protein NP233_g3878 [Leucocoprinus birnbaumii]
MQKVVRIQYYDTQRFQGDCRLTPSQARRVSVINSTSPNPSKPCKVYSDSDDGDNAPSLLDVTNIKREQRSGETSIPQQIRPELQVTTPLHLHIPYSTYEAVEEAVYTAEKALGFSWRPSQILKDQDGNMKKRTISCTSYAKPQTSHLAVVDPGDWRQGKSGRSDCKAHVNILSQAGGAFWTLMHIDLEHNHPSFFSPWRLTASTPLIISAQTYVEGEIWGSSFGGSPDHHIMISDGRREAQDTADAEGGYFAGVIAHLRCLKQQDPGLDLRLQLDTSNTVVALCAYNCNAYSCTLKTGIAIDSLGKSRNIWYCLQKSESVAMHTWILQSHLDAARQAPEVLASDRHIFLCIAVPSVMPFTQHIYYLHHLTSNINQNLRSRIGHKNWVSFNQKFWVIWR